MRAEKAVHTLLAAASAVTTLLGAPQAPATANIWAGQAPQGVAFPVIVVEHISARELTTIDANSAFGLNQARLQVTAIAKTYNDVKAVLEQIRIALNYQRGTVSGVRVISIIRDTVGPDLRDDDRKLFSQSIDFQVTYQEP
jgi:hypothetical protein